MKTNTLNAGKNWLLLMISGGVFYWVLYPIVLETLGIITGFFLMLISSFLICLLGFYIRIKTKKDWFYLEKFKAMERDLKRWKGNGAKRFVAYIFKKFEPLFFIFLSCWFNPVIAVVYTADPGYYENLRFKEWKLFLISIVVNNIYHTIMALGVVNIISLISSIV